MKISHCETRRLREHIMEEKKFISNWIDDVESVPENYVYPAKLRPGNLVVSMGKAIPVVDLAGPDKAHVVCQILKASEEFGFFQVINHGVSKTLLDDTISIFKDFHKMSAADKARECSRDPNRSCRVYTGSENYSNEQIHCWRDALLLHSHPLHKYVQFWPQNPTKFREVVGAYAVAVRKLCLEILELICEGLGLMGGYLGDKISENPVLLSNYYPPCPNPSLTLGLLQHCDPSLITILFQDVNGLQVLKDGNWFGVEPIDHAFVVNIGYILQIISNGKLKAAEHRAVTNSKTSRQSITYLVYPEDDANVGPATSLVNETNPPRYRSLKHREFQKNYSAFAPDTKKVMQYMSSNNA